MGMLVDGTWFDNDPPPDGTGRFVRPDSIFRDRVTRDGSSGFKAEPGRYQLVTAPSCPWAHRTVLMRKLKRLESAIPLLESDLPKGEGWAYSRGFDELRPKDGVFHVHQIYSAARPDYTGRATVPLLWDRQSENHRQQRIIRNHPHAECGIRLVGRRLARPLPAGPPPRHRRNQRIRLRRHQQWRIPRRSRQKPGRLTKKPLISCSRPSTNSKLGSGGSAGSSATVSPRPICACSRPCCASTRSITCCSSAICGA